MIENKANWENDAQILRFLVSDLTDNSLHVMMKGLIESLDISYEQPTVTYPSTNSSTDVS